MFFRTSNGRVLRFYLTYVTIVEHGHSIKLVSDYCFVDVNNTLLIDIDTRDGTTVIFPTKLNICNIGRIGVEYFCIIDGENTTWMLDVNHLKLHKIEN